MGEWLSRKQSCYRSGLSFQLCIDPIALTLKASHLLTNEAEVKIVLSAFLSYLLCDVAFFHQEIKQSVLVFEALHF